MTTRCLVFFLFFFQSPSTSKAKAVHVSEMTPRGQGGKRPEGTSGERSSSGILRKSAVQSVVAHPKKSVITPGGGKRRAPEQPSQASPAKKHKVVSCQIFTSFFTKFSFVLIFFLKIYFHNTIFKIVPSSKKMVHSLRYLLTDSLFFVCIFSVQASSIRAACSHTNQGEDYQAVQDAQGVTSAPGAAAEALVFNSRQTNVFQGIYVSSDCECFQILKTMLQRKGNTFILLVVFCLFSAQIEDSGQEQAQVVQSAVRRFRFRIGYRGCV